MIDVLLPFPDPPEVMYKCDQCHLNSITQTENQPQARPNNLLCPEHYGAASLSFYQQPCQKRRMETGQKLFKTVGSRNGLLRRANLEGLP